MTYSENDIIDALNFQEEDLKQRIVEKIDDYYFKNNLQKDVTYGEILLIVAGA